MKVMQSVVSATGFALLGSVALAASPVQREVQFDLPSQPLSAALVKFGEQSDLRVIFYTDRLEGIDAPEVQGSLTPEQALRRLLQKSALLYEFVDDRTVSIFAAEDVGRTEGTRQGIPEVLVSGSRILNMDVVRTRDDAQPYQILDSGAIERSNAVSVESFLKRSLPANTAALSDGQLNVNAAGNASKINLRNLGTQSTLVLINGRRAIGAAYFGGNLQADVNTIPLSAIERIEVLPSAASAIYGGAAMGGVVNVVLKQNYDGGEARVRYENTFDADAPIRSYDFSYGTSLEEGRSNVLLTGHYSETQWLVNADRPELMQRGYQRVLQNSPGLLYSTTNPF
ncbi:TonB-dependent receptor, partial [Steroidobacter sp.]|uniref:TonB-dependent receptor n=1 Tax=Steroidobacter sp. TaxID=1978227 RepID=UPI001A61F674